MSRALSLSVVLALATGVLAGCGPAAIQTVSLKMSRQDKTPRDASVTIDEEYIGPLGWVAARGVRLPAGTHRISVEKDGYFPYDVAVVAGKDTIHLNVTLVPIPD